MTEQEKRERIAKETKVKCGRCGYINRIPKPPKAGYEWGAVCNRCGDTFNYVVLHRSARGGR